MGELLDRLKPRSFRTRMAAAFVAVMLAVVLGAELISRTVVEGQIRRSVEQTLDLQAREFVGSIARDGFEDIPQIARFFPDTYVEVRVDGALVYYARRPIRDRGVTGRASIGSVEVALTRRAGTAGVSPWLLPLLLSLGLTAAAGLVWYASGQLADRLRRSASELADVAEHVAHGDRSVRAPERDDELGRLAIAMNRMTSELEAADLRQREFIADAAHELRTPVTAIEGFAEALIDGTASAEEDRTEAAEFIREEAARLRQIVSDLQELTWLDLDPPISWRHVDLGEIGRASLERFGPQAAEAGITLVGPTGAVPATSDPGHLDTILANLISNALRATPPGGRVEVRAGCDSVGNWIRVIDTGKGISQEHLPYLFDRLFRVGSARDREGGGSGLGLAIVKRLVQRLGGKITVQSAPGHGTTFIIRLPAQRTGRRRGRGQGTAEITAVGSGAEETVEASSA